MKKISIFVLIFLVSIIQNVYAQTEVRKPEEVFRMIFDVLMKKDKAVLETLNNYSQRMVNNYEITNDYFDIINRGAFNGVPKQSMEMCKHEINDLNTAINNALANVQITDINTEIVLDEYSSEDKIAEITYSVNFLVPQRLLDISRTKMKKATPTELKKFLFQVINELKNADKKVTVKNVFTLNQVVDEDKIYYVTSYPEKLRSDIISSYIMSLIEVAEK